MPTRIELTAAALIACVAACSPRGDRGAPAVAPVRELRYDGSTTISRRVLPEALSLFEGRSGVKVRVDRSGTGIGLRRLFAGEVDVAGVSRRLTPDELGRKPYFQIVGYDALGIWVNAATAVQGLSREQLRGIFTGTVKSWRQLGGKDVPLKVCTEHLASARATLEHVQTTVMDGLPYGPAKELEDPVDCLQWVAQTPGAITAASVGLELPGVRTILVDGLAPSPANIRSSRYLLTRPLLLVTREAPGGPLAGLLDAVLSPEGQAIVARAGFVPAR